jgi:two-component system NarL family response regulator
LKKIKLVVATRCEKHLQQLTDRVRGEKDITLVGTIIIKDFQSEMQQSIDFVEQMTKEQPDILLLDQVILREVAALDLGRVLSYRNKLPTTKTIILGKHFNEENIMAMMVFHWGVQGFFRATQDNKNLIKCIRKVAQGEFWLDAVLTARVFAELIKECMKKKDRLKYLTHLSKAKLDMLSLREMEILELISQSMTNEEIADELSLSELTVKTHLRQIFEKAGIRNRTEAALVYTRHALISY